MSLIEVAIKQLDPDLELPCQAYKGDGAVDLRSRIDITLAPGERAAIPTGIAVAIPEEFGGLVIPRSGLAIKHGISVVNGPGLIDSGYRGEIGVILINTDLNSPFEINRGDRIAQLAIVPLPTIKFNVVTDLDETDRKQGGFGSSGI